MKIPKISLFTTIIYHYKQIIFAYNHTFHRNLLGKKNMNSLQSAKGHEMLLHLIYIILLQGVVGKDIAKTKAITCVPSILANKRPT